MEKYEIDLDTDGDGIGNKSDTDDDADGQTDEEEKIAGTNPLVFDKKIIQSQDNSNSNGQGNNSILIENETGVLTEKIIDKTREIASEISKTFIETADNTKKILEREKEKIDEELKQEAEKIALETPTKIDKNQNQYIASLVENIPELKEVYSFFLAVLIYILNSWWILLGSITIIIYFLWKMISKKLFKRSY